MLKAKNIMVILIVNYLLIVIFCSFSEILFLTNKAQNIQLMIRTAADMALEQVQATDDFFLPDNGYMLGEGVVEYQIRAPYEGGADYKSVSAFKAMTGKTTKKDIFMSVYGGGRMSEFINSTNVTDIEVSAAYWDTNPDNPFSTLQWFKIPKIAQMGDDVIMDGGVPYNYKRALDSSRSLANSTITQGIWDAYGLGVSEKKAFNQNTGDIETYFYSPLSLGITYINEDLLQYFFMNNMDLLMRSKYVKSGIPLNTEEGGNGVLKGSTYTDLIDEGSLVNANPIHNGEFTLLRGNKVYDADTNALLFEGMKPKIRYKVIDMYGKTPENEELLSLLFGAYPNENGSKGDYFKLQDSHLRDPGTGSTYDSKPIVVAEVTFYVDAIIPYTTIPLREMRGKENENNELDLLYLFDSRSYTAQSGNYLDIIREGELSSGIPSVLGNTSNVIQYTRLFAVAP